MKLVPETPQRPRKRRGRTSTPPLTCPFSSFLPPFLPPLGRCPPLPRPGGLWGRTAGRVGTLKGAVSGGKVPPPRRYCRGGWRGLTLPEPPAPPTTPPGTCPWPPWSLSLEETESQVLTGGQPGVGGHTSRRSCRSQELLIKVLKSGLSLAGNASAQRRGMLAALLENAF